MPDRSALARLQQVTTLGLLGLSLAWLGWHWQRSILIAISGAFAIFFSYSLFLGAEFLLVKIIAKGDPVPPPTWSELMRAWWAETRMLPVVFFWRQPFRWRAQPDFVDPSMQGRRGVVLVHGFVCNRGMWNPWMNRLREAGHPFIAVNLEPVFGSIDAYTDIIEDAVQRLTSSTGQQPLIVCHSMGGLAVRAWSRAKHGEARAYRVITIGSPHHGTWLGRLSHTINGQQMRLDGDWVRELARTEPIAPFTCWYSNCDNIVFPASAAMLEGADNRFLSGIAHVELAFTPPVLAHALDALREQG